jgi:hypothetical protein
MSMPGSAMSWAVYGQRFPHQALLIPGGVPWGVDLRLVERRLPVRSLRGCGPASAGSADPERFPIMHGGVKDQTAVAGRFLVAMDQVVASPLFVRREQCNEGINP